MMMNMDLLGHLLILLYSVHLTILPGILTHIFHNGFAVVEIPDMVYKDATSLSQPIPFCFPY